MDNISRLDEELKSIESKILQGQGKLDGRTINATAAKLNNMADELERIQKGVQEKTQRIAADAIGIKTPEQDVRIAELKERITACQKSIQEAGSSHREPGILSRIFGWFSSSSEPVQETPLDEDFVEIKKQETLELALELAIEGMKNPEVCLLEGKSFESLPDNFGSLEKIQAVKHLMLNNNKLKKVPDSMGKLAHLEALELGDNELKELPISMGKLNLHTLYINNNPIEDLPPCVYQMQELKVLDIANTNITYLDLAALEKLSFLYINNDKQELLHEYIKGVFEKDSSLKERIKIKFRS